MDPEWTAEKELCQRRGMPYVGPAAKGKVEDEEHMAAEASGIPLGGRCEVDPGGKRGVVRYTFIGTQRRLRLSRQQKGEEISIFR